jgi:hypothetical protein
LHSTLALIALGWAVDTTHDVVRCTAFPAKPNICISQQQPVATLRLQYDLVLNIANMTKDWDAVQDEIKELSFNQKKPLEEVKELMEKKYKFHAS